MARGTAPTFSLALGSGGARGIAHIGVLTVLEREGLRPRAVAGTSMGSFIGAMYAAGTHPERMAAGVDSLDYKEIVSLTALTLKPGSFLTADRIEGQLRGQLPATFAELRIPFACVCADLVTGEPVVISEGDLPRAIRTSMSIPVMFDPVRDGDRILVDGGVVDPVPVRLAKELGGAPVVAVDVGSLVASAPDEARRGLTPALHPDGSPNVLQIGTRTLDVMSHWIARPSLDEADVVISPDVGGYSFAEVLEGPAIIEAGVRAAEAALPAIRAALEESARTPLERAWRSLTGR
jgi:NTE family protein